jgi:hypothetical protein
VGLFVGENKNYRFHTRITPLRNLVVQRRPSRYDATLIYSIPPCDPPLLPVEFFAKGIGALSHGLGFFGLICPAE